MLNLNSWPLRLALILMLLAVALALTACGGSTGTVRPDLDPPGLTALRNEVIKRCSNIPRAWPAEAEASQQLTEEMVQRDQADTEACAGPAVRFANRIATRDAALEKSIKK